MSARAESGSSPDEPGATARRPGDPPAGDADGRVGEVTRRPTLLSRRLGLVAGTLVTLLGGLYATAAVVLGLVGTLALWAATVEGRRGLVDGGGAGLLLATVVAGPAAPVPVTLACTVGSVVAWDLATNAVELGEQVGREPDTARAEFTHAMATTGVGVVLAGVAYGVYTVGAGGRPAGAVIALLVGVLALLSAMRL
jgi:hypothetical protein